MGCNSFSVQDTRSSSESWQPARRQLMCSPRQLFQTRGAVHVTVRQRCHSGLQGGRSCQRSKSKRPNGFCGCTQPLTSLLSLQELPSIAALYVMYPITPLHEKKPVRVELPATKEQDVPFLQGTLYHNESPACTEVCRAPHSAVCTYLNVRTSNEPEDAGYAGESPV